MKAIIFSLLVIITVIGAPAAPLPPLHMSGPPKPFAFKIQNLPSGPKKVSFQPLAAFGAFGSNNDESVLDTTSNANTFDREHPELVQVNALLDQLTAKLHTELDSSEAAAAKAKTASDTSAAAQVTAQKAFDAASDALTKSKSAAAAALQALNDATKAYNDEFDEVTKELRLINMLKQILGAQNDCDGIKRTGSNSCYKVIKTTDLQTYPQATATCNAWYGAWVASVLDATENAWLRAQCPATTNMWLGGTDNGHEGRWTWADGTDITYKNWSAGEPNNCVGCGPANVFGAGENNMEMYPDGHWNDIPGGLARANCFVCKRS